MTNTSSENQPTQQIRKCFTCRGEFEPIADSLYCEPCKLTKKKAPTAIFKGTGWGGDDDKLWKQTIKETGFTPAPGMFKGH